MQKCFKKSNICFAIHYYESDIFHKYVYAFLPRDDILRFSRNCISSVTARTCSDFPLLFLQPQYFLRKS